MKLTIAAALAAAALVAAAGSEAAAGTLLHSYDFSTSMNGYVLDQTGSENGLLQGDAHVAGGKVVFDGTGDAVQFATQLIPFSSDFSVFLRVKIPAQVRNISEIIAQGASGAPGFYIGNYGSTYRLTDDHYSTAIPFHADDNFHNLLLTNSVAGGFRFSIDNTVRFSAATPTAFGGSCATRLGDQFCGFYNEGFKGEIDALKIYSGVATYAQATSGAPEPGAWAMMLVGFGGLGAVLRRRRARTTLVPA